MSSAVYALRLVAVGLFLAQISSASGCSDGDARLAGGASEYEGRVELCYNGVWGTVCDDNMDDLAAAVVCAQLGLPPHDPKAVKEYGGGSGPILFDEFQCRGNESNLLECHHNGIGLHNCGTVENAGVSCAPPCSDDDVRLLRKRVQVCHNEMWGYVCEDGGWRDNDAGIVCGQLGYSRRGATSDYDYLFYEFEFSTFPFFLNETSCDGSEEYLVDCSHSGFGDYDCEFFSVVSSCSEYQPCEETGATRLTDVTGSGDNYTMIIGRLEICVDGQWGSVCDDAVNSATASVVCRQIGHATEGEIYYRGLFDEIVPNIPILLDDVLCIGNESSLLECVHNGIGVHDCNHFEDVVVGCLPHECNETDVRLVDGRTPHDGRVEVCLEGLWGSVCDDQWDYREAAVVCRQLGYNGSSYALREYGDSPNTIDFHLDDVACTGSESKLVHCRHPGVGIHNCRRGIDEAAVICTDSPCEEGAVYLVSGHNAREGRVQVCYSGEWHSICSDKWEETEADVVCTSLGYSAELVSVVSGFGRGTNPLLPWEIQCTGDEATLGNCSTTAYDPNQCQQVAGVICEAPCLSNNVTDCNDCSSEADCRAIHSGLCSCTSDCYSSGHCCPDVDHIENCVVPECKTGEVRLVGGVANSSSGVVEVCANRVWGAVCDYQNEWTQENTEVVCSQLGLPTSNAVSNYSVFGSYTGPVLLDDIHCTGEEATLLDCSHASIGNHLCGPATDPNRSFQVTIKCKDDCVEGEVRLQDGTDPSNGRVEVCQNGTWGSVCASQWDLDDARVVCKQLGYSSDDQEVKATSVFGPGGTVFLSDVQCTGTEDRLHVCPSVGIGSHSCSKQNSAGVICSKRFDIPVQCSDDKGTPPLNQTRVKDIERFGECVPYKGETEVCDEVLTAGVDYVFITRAHHTQGNVTAFIKENILSALISTSGSSHCKQLIYRMICKYYLIPCGTETNQLPPSTICPEECSAVQAECGPAWDAASLGLKGYQFISCEDTSALVFPLPNCCTGARQTDTGDKGRQSSGVAGGAAAGAVLGTLLCVGLAAAIVVVVLVYIRKRRSHRKVAKLQMDIFAMPGAPNPYNSDIVAGNEGVLEASTHFSNVGGVEANPYSVPRPLNDSQPSRESLEVGSGSLRTRVNSHYMRELTHGQFIINHEQLTLLENIGQGEFGIVYRASLVQKKGQEGSGTVVAVKTLKGHFDQLEIDKIVEESLKMSRFKHSHVMGLIGICHDAGPAPYIVMPYMANGSLLHHLKKERSNLVLVEGTDEDVVQEICKRLMVMCSQIASGMKYLAEEMYIHRDLAARNCMIDSHFVIKITDFGLSEDMYMRNYFRQGMAGEVVKLPVKWMAPESLSDGHFSEKSDVWSYGVTMWEIFSGGKAPYPGADPLSLMQRLEVGDRMPIPTNAACTEEIYTMMRKCWEMDPKDRPTFKELHTNTSQYMERIAGYLEIQFNPFAGRGTVQSPVVDERETEEEKGGFDAEVKIKVTPASVIIAPHAAFADISD